MCNKLLKDIEDNDGKITKSDTFSLQYKGVFN